MAEYSTATCHDCGESKQKLGIHWAKSTSCDYPSFTQRQHKILTGLLMGDGCISVSGKNPFMNIIMTNKEFLSWVSSEFGARSTDIRVNRTAEQQASHSRHTGFNENADQSNYNTTYKLTIRSNPNLSEYQLWYKSGEKRFPESINLCPLTLSVWYACDGSRKFGNRLRAVPAIGVSNESTEKEKIQRMFSRAGFDNVVISDDRLYLNKQEAEKFYEVTDPVPGFEYKWNQNA